MMGMMGEILSTSPETYGLMAEFKSSDELVEAAHQAKAAGYEKVEAYSPFPIEEVSEALGHKRSKVALITLIGGTVGALTGFFLQYWTQVYVYPMNVGGRPHNSWPSFIVVTFELTILFAALSAVFGMILLNRLPQPYHPVFNVERFAERASKDRFFLCIEAADNKYDREGTEAFLRRLNPREVAEVES